MEEKIDGSQFSFGKFPIVAGEDNFSSLPTGEFELRVRSKGAVFPIDAPPKMFTLACDTVRHLSSRLTPGWTYRAEYLAKPKHNTLAYDRIPKGGLILFDVCREQEDYLSYQELQGEALRLDMDVVPLLYEGKISEPSMLREFFNTQSVLGGQKIEGVVIKPRLANIFGIDKKLMLAKFVSEAFKEVHTKDWKEREPGQIDFLQRVIESYGTPPRWNKAIQHLREAGQLEDSPRDIGKLIAEIPIDILKEEEATIKDRLFAYFWPTIRRGVIRGFPEFYKQQLLERQFEHAGTGNTAPASSGREESDREGVGSAELCSEPGGAPVRVVE